MPGNEAKDRVHNFFPQVDSSSSHHHSQAVDRSWQGLGNDLWPNSNSKGYNLQQSDIERGQSSNSFQVADDLNYDQPTLGPVLSRSHSQSQLPNLNGYMHNHQIGQIRQNESNFLGVGAESDRYTMTSRGLSFYESQGQNIENNRGSVRSETSESRNNIGMLQSMPQQLSGFNDTQLMQQQAMLRKMQELQRHNYSLNQNPSIINGTPVSPFTSASNNTFPIEPSSTNKSWLHHASQAAQEQGQPLRFNQSIYGQPVSNISSSSNPYSHVSVDTHKMQQMAMYNNFSPRDQCRGPPDRVNVQDGSMSSRQGFQEGNFFGQQMGGRAILPVSSLQDAVALDPTEEKILFGDGNIWDSFGDEANVAPVGGSWSALMQSAVAEAPSNDVGLQEKWSGGGPSIQNTEVGVGPLSNVLNINTSFQGVQSYQNTPHSSDAKSMPRSWTAQQNVPSHISGQPYGKFDGQGDMATLSFTPNEGSGFYGNEGRLQRPDSNDQKRVFHGEMSQGVRMWQTVPGPQSTGGLEQVRLGIGSPQVNREELNLNNFSGRLNSVTARASENNLNFWKQAEPSNFIGGNEHHLKNSSERKENSSESHHSNISQHADDKVRLDGSNTRNLLGEKQNVSGSRKFQYHPMGNLDENIESSLGRKNVSNNQSGYSGQSKIFGQFPQTSSEIEKGHMIHVQQTQKGADDPPSRGTLAGFSRNTSSLSQNVPKFLHNMDQFKENSNSDGSMDHLQQSRSPSSHDVGLQLGFQSFSTQTHELAHRSAQLAGSNSSAHTTHGTREKRNASQAEPLPSSRETSQVEFMKNEISGTSPSQQNLLGGQSHKFPPGIFRPGQLNNNAVATLVKGGLHQVGSSADVAPEPSVSLGKESALKNQSDASPSNSASTERDFEAFGRSLKPNNLPNQSYSLLNQMRAKQSTETDPSNRDLKRFKGAECSVGSQMRQSSEPRVMVGDPKIQNFLGSESPINSTNSSSLVANVPQNGIAPSRMDSGNYPCSTSSSSWWFKQGDTFKNGQMLSTSDAQKPSTSKIVEQWLPLTMEQANAVTDSFQADNICERSVPTPITADNSPSAQLMAHDLINKGLVKEKPKKPKSVVPLPWHKEVTQGSQSLFTSSMAEAEWAKATNRVIEKVEDEEATLKYKQLRRRSKRRLILTTHLMQQLFQPPEAAILSADASSNSEAVSCMSGRVALGDACSIMVCSKSGSSAPPDSINSLIDEHKTTGSEGTGNQKLSEVTERFIARAKKLENEFMRLDKRTSVADSRLESQEMEKISIINRFAKFHGPSQPNSVPAGPQRYVNALPMPKVLPERSQCLSL